LKFNIFEYYHKQITMNEQYFELIKLLATVILAALGWIIAHYFTARRDKKNKKRELSLQHLISAYQILTNDISHRYLTDERNERLEKVVTDIQLFGTPKQIEFAKKLSYDLADKRGFELDPLINDLRNDLRKQLGLDNVIGNVTWLRFNENS